MAGHSHWANIQRTKSKMDAKRGKVFSKCAKLIMSAAKQGGADPDMNLRLRYAIDGAKAVNMPKDSIERAIKKGAGELGDVNFEELLYEAYAPGGVAVLIEALTDNRNRTAPEVRMILDRRGGSLGESGSVAWNFDRKALFAIKREGIQEDDFMMFALENGADDVDTEETEILAVTAEPGQYHVLKAALEENSYTIEDSGLRYIPKNEVDVDSETGEKVLALMEALEDNEDVQGVFCNAAFPEGLQG